MWDTPHDASRFECYRNSVPSTILALICLSSALPDPVLVPIFVSIVTPVPISVNALVFDPAPVPVPILCSSPGLHPRPRPRCRPVPALVLVPIFTPWFASTPVAVPVPAPAPSPSPSPFTSPFPPSTQFCLRSRPRLQSRYRLHSLLPVPRTRLPPRYDARVQTPGLANGAVGCSQAPPSVCRDGDSCGMKAPVVKQKQNHRRRRATSVPSARCWNSLECVSNLCSTRLMASSLMRTCTSEPTLPHVDIARKEGGSR